MKTAIVTGASSGIGEEICITLLKKNIKVYGFSRTPSQKIVNYDNFIPILVDITDYEKVKLALKTIQRNDTVDYLINSAGVGYFGPHEELNIQKIKEMTRTNLEAPLILTQLLLRELKKTKGTIINISSVTAKKCNTHGCAYGATKAALSSFSESLFEENRKYGIKVITIHPDMTKTNFYNKNSFETGEDPASYLLPQEIANCVEYLISLRDDIVPTEITLKPQLHRIKRK